MPRKFAAHILPWLLASAALAIYAATCSRGVSLLNLGLVARLAGWQWLPPVTSPVLYLATLPGHWLPPVCLPIILNLLSAVCAALVLALLARSAVLLPHDPRPRQHLQETWKFSLLEIRAAWLPPTLAVLACGLQLSFWEHAVNGGGAMLDLLLFALVIWLLLEYRIDKRDGRLHLAGFLFGTAIANDWLPLIFLPLFAVWIIFLRGFEFDPVKVYRFFSRPNFQFFSRFLLCFLAGLAFCVVLPAAAAFNGGLGDAWPVLRAELKGEYDALTQILFRPGLRQAMLAIAFTTVLPSFLIIVRTKLAEQVDTRISAALRWLLDAVAAAVLCVCLWTAFDPPFSPRRLGLGPPLLIFNYLAALNAGYFAGYFLLTFRNRRCQNPVLATALNWTAIAAVAGLMLAVAAGLVGKNFPRLARSNGTVLREYADLAAASLPVTGGVLSSTDAAPLFLVQDALARRTNAGQFVPVDLAALKWPAYHRFMRKKFPAKWPAIINAEDASFAALPAARIQGFLNSLAASNEIWSLNPGPAAGFDAFNLEPHGLVFVARRLPEDTLLPAANSPGLLAEKEAFWEDFSRNRAGSIAAELARANPGRPRGWFDNLLRRLHATQEIGREDQTAGAYYSRALDGWGAEAQRAEKTAAAGKWFALAEQMNPGNRMARINAQFNQALLAGKSPPLDPAKAREEQFGRDKSWCDITTETGPPDEPSYCFGAGKALAQQGLTGSAAGLLVRACFFAPRSALARIWLAKVYTVAKLPAPALGLIMAVREQPERFSLTDGEHIQINFVEAQARIQSGEIRRSEILVQGLLANFPTNDFLLKSCFDLWLQNGLYTNALGVADARLRTAPPDLEWRFARGLACLAAGRTDEAIAAFTMILDKAPGNVGARVNRAIALYGRGQFAAARADYEYLHSTHGEFREAILGLADCASQLRQTNDAIKYYQLYLEKAGPAAPEAVRITRRLAELGARK